MDDLGAHHGDDAASGGEDRLLTVRARLDEVEELPLEERAGVFEEAHRVVVEELRALEL